MGVSMRDNSVIKNGSLSIHDRDYQLVAVERMIDILPGDSFSIHYSLQADNEVGYVLGWTTFPAYSFDRQKWVTLGGRMGQNISPQRHHDVQSRSVTYRHTMESLSKMWFAVFARAYSTASKAGDILEVVKSYISVAKIR